MNRTAHVLKIEVFWPRAKVSTQSTAIDITRRTCHARYVAPEETVSTKRRSIPGIPTGSQWKNRKDDAAARGGCRHKAMYWSIAKQASPYIAVDYKTPADATFLQAQPWPNEPRGSNCSSVKRPRHIKPGNLVPTEHNRSEMGLTIGCLEKCTDHTAFVSRNRKTINGLIPTQRTT